MFNENALGIPALCFSVLQTLEKHQPSMEHPPESQLSPALLQPPKPAGKSFFPAVPVASKVKPSLSVHTGKGVKESNHLLSVGFGISFGFCFPEFA